MPHLAAPEFLGTEKQARPRAVARSRAAARRRWSTDTALSSAVSRLAQDEGRLGEKENSVPCNMRCQRGDS